METILSILIVLGCLIALLLLIALFIPKHYTVTVEETIKRPKEAVYAYVSLLGEQLAYSEWLMHDATLQSRLEGVDGTVGATLKWESRNPDKNKSAGKGELEIKAMDPDSIAVELRLLEPMAGVCQLKNEFTERGPSETSYTCIFSAHAKFPLNLPSYLIGRHFIRKTQQKTMRNIKSILEREHMDR